VIAATSRRLAASSKALGVRVTRIKGMPPVSDGDAIEASGMIDSFLA
jgi:hypothetical protein